jgi:steroid delta-isomerase-like uncharacterized protein
MAADNNNTEIQRKFWEAINRGDIDAVDNYLAPDLVEHENLPSGYSHDREGVKQMFRAYRKAFPDLKIDVQRIFSNGDLVADDVICTGTHRGEFMGVAPTGKRVQVELMDFSRIARNKVVEHWGMADQMSLWQQLGVNLPIGTHSH